METFDLTYLHLFYPLLIQQAAQRYAYSCVPERGRMFGATASFTHLFSATVNSEKSRVLRFLDSALDAGFAARELFMLLFSFFFLLASCGETFSKAFSADSIDCLGNMNGFESRRC